MYVDIFNGDADGICALIQLRNAEAVDSRLVTGVKRDISLVKKAGIQQGDKVTVLDISLDKNRDGLLAALELAESVLYVDHHFAGDIPQSDKLTCLINPEPEVCTALLVNGHLQGQFAEWAVVGAYGDNLKVSAEKLADQLGLNEEQKDLLDRLGVCINYNAYGATEADLHITPADLFKKLVAYPSPLAFIEQARDEFDKLEAAYQADMKLAAEAPLLLQETHAAVVSLPGEAWARRVSGVFGNDLANKYPDRAHAVITEKAEGGYLVSVRAPLSNRSGADELCMKFETGGGRKAAAGINHLPAEDLQNFCDTFSEFYAQV